MDKYVRWLGWAAAICFVLILSLMTMDWLTKYTMYLDQRDKLHGLIRSGVIDIDGYKQTVSYLQGTATRRLNEIEQLTTLFGSAFFAFYLFTRNLIRRDNHA